MELTQAEQEFLHRVLDEWVAEGFTTPPYPEAFYDLAAKVDYRLVHEAYPNPVGGGWDGYQGACHTCDWTAPHVRRSKDEARRDALHHVGP